MKLFYQYINEIKDGVKERRFGFEEFEAGTASILIPDNTPQKGSISVSATETEINRIFKKDKETGELRIFVKTNDEHYPIDLEYEITSRPFDGPRIRNSSGNFLQYLKLLGYWNGLSLTARPPRIKKDGTTEHDLNRESHIVMDGRNVGGTKISNNNIIYFTNQDLEKALQSTKQRQITPQSTSAPIQPTTFRNAGQQSGPMTVMSPSQIVAWSTGKVVNAIKIGLSNAGITQMKIKDNVIVFISNDGNKKAFRVNPPTPDFSRNQWINGKWRIQSTDNKRVDFIVSDLEKGVSPVTNGILPNLNVITNRIKEMI